MSKKTTIYLDNNGTTIPPKIVCDTIAKWTTAGNPSSGTYLANESIKMMDSCKELIANICGVSIKTHTIVFTSGASESNSFIIRACVDAYTKKIGKPHIITSAIEHKCILETCHELVEENRIKLSLIMPDRYGNIDPKKVKASIKPNTCLISIMAVNNELGSINDLKAIGDIAHKAKIPFHSDITQAFIKIPTPLNINNVNAASISFHKVYGPKGCGALVVDNKLIEGYDLKSQIGGIQNKGLRGGTENVPGIAASLAGMKWMMNNRKDKNERLEHTRNIFIEELEKIAKITSVDKYFDERPHAFDELEFVILGPEKNHVNHTILLSIVKNEGDGFCNVKFKKYLESKGVIVSIGSACNTMSKEASHVIKAIKVPPIIRQGVIRVSFGDRTTIKEIKTAVEVMKSGIEAQNDKKDKK